MLRVCVCSADTHLCFFYFRQKFFKYLAPLRCKALSLKDSRPTAGSTERTVKTWWRMTESSVAVPPWYFHGCATEKQGKKKNKTKRWNKLPRAACFLLHSELLKPRQIFNLAPLPIPRKELLKKGRLGKQWENERPATTLSPPKPQLYSKYRLVLFFVPSKSVSSDILGATAALGELMEGVGADHR